MPELSGPDRLRLAVAIAVLRSKPQDISLPAYILSLYPSFPPSGPAPPIADYRWKTYALKLESEIDQLKEKYEAQKTELLALDRSASDTAPPEASTALSAPADSIKKKVKGKKTPGASDVKSWPDLSNIQQIDIPIPRSGELLLALRAFGKIVSGSNKDASTLLHSMLRIIQIASRILTPIIDQTSAKTSGSVTVSVLGKILSHTIMTSLPSLGVQRQSSAPNLVLSDIDKVFDSLIECIFRPIILAFRKITHASLSALVLSESSFRLGGSLNPSLNMESADLRQDLLGLFKVLVDTLHSVSVSAYKQDRSKLYQWAIGLSSLKACLNLEIIRELGKVLFPEAKPPLENGSDTELGNELWNQGTNALPGGVPLTVPASASLASSVAYVVAKDVLWFLCSLMHILADLTEGTKADSDVLPSVASQDSHALGKRDGSRDETLLLELLNDAVLSALYDLALKCQSIIDCGEEGSHSKLGTLDEMPHRTHVGNSLTIDRHHARRGNVLFKGDKQSSQNSQAQGRVSLSSDNQSEVGDPNGSGLRVRLDVSFDVTTSVQVGSSGYDPDSRFGHTYQKSTDGVTTSPEAQAAPVGRSVNCLIDEVGFTMLLGVVERFILGSEYTR